MISKVRNYNVTEGKYEMMNWFDEFLKRITLFLHHNSTIKCVKLMIAYRRSFLYPYRYEARKRCRREWYIYRYIFGPFVSAIHTPGKSLWIMVECSSNIAAYEQTSYQQLHPFQIYTNYIPSQNYQNVKKKRK